MLGGVGELDKNRRPNFYVVEKSMYRSLHKAPPFIRSTSQVKNTAGHRLLRALLNNRQLVTYGIAIAAAVTTTTSISTAFTATTTIQLSLLLLVLFNLCGGMSLPQFSVPKQYINGEFPVAIGLPPIVELTVTNDSLVMGR